MTDDKTAELIKSTSRGPKKKSTRRHGELG